MMYSHLPPAHALVARLVLALAWLLMTLGGLSALLFPPLTIETPLGQPVMSFWAAVVFIGSGVATVGVLWDRYRLEWASSWFTAGGLSIYATAVWWHVFSGEVGRLTQALLVTALVAAAMSRAALCAAYAKKLRGATRG